MTIRTRIVAFSTFVFAIVICGFAYLLDRSVRTEELAKLDARLESHADKVSTELEEQESEQQFPDTKAFTDLHTDGLPRVSIQLFDTSGRPVFPVGTDSPIWDKVPGAHSILSGRQIVRILSLSSEPEEHGRYIIQVSAPANEMEERLETLHRFLFIGVPLSILLTALGASVFVRLAFKPISQMASAAAAISGSNLVARVPLPTSNDEVRRLASTLNEMISRLEVSFTTQKQFIADASHEIRTPLTVIYAELEYLAGNVQDAELRESVKTSMEEVDRLVRLSNNMLFLARLDSDREPVQKTVIRLDELLAGCVSKVKSLAAAKSISLRLLIDEPVEISTDSDKCVIILMNLLDNAIKYSQSETTITAELKSLPGTSTVQIIIYDQGIGISQSDLEHIFDRFYRVDQSRSTVRGTGLGLAIVRRLVNLLGGSLAIESIHSTSPGQAANSSTDSSGTTITVTFPLK